MGSPNALAYLASPAVVAASAIAGKIVTPFDVTEEVPEKQITLPDTKPTQPSTASTSSTVNILEGFPESIEGEIIFVDADNLNTDGIYPGIPSAGKSGIDKQENIRTRIAFRGRKCEKSVWRIMIPSSGISREMGISCLEGITLEPVQVVNKRPPQSS